MPYNYVHNSESSLYTFSSEIATGNSPLADLKRRQIIRSTKLLPRPPFVVLARPPFVVLALWVFEPLLVRICRVFLLIDCHREGKNADNFCCITEL
jgi:hypothetical protein